MQITRHSISLAKLLQVIQLTIRIAQKVTVRCHLVSWVIIHHETIKRMVIRIRSS